MAGNQFSSADKGISVSGPKPASANPSALLNGLTKDVRKRWILVGSGVAGIILVSSAMLSGDPEPSTPRAKEAVQVDTSPKGLSTSNDWRAQAGADMLTLKKEVEASRKQQTELMSTLAMIREEMQSMSKAQVQARAAEPKKDLNLPTPPAPPASLRPPVQPPVVSTGSTAATSTTGSAINPSQSLNAMTPQAKPVEVIKRAPARSFLPVSVVDKNAEAAAVRVDTMVNNDRKGFLPGGSFANATMISGLEAFTGGTAQAQPQPLVLRIDTNAILPNAANYQIKGCHVLASAYGDLSSERVFGRLATLTCVDTKNRLVLSEDVEGVLVDSDGKNGIRGEVQDRQGAKLARSLLAGFAEGLSSAFGEAQSTVTNTAFGTTTAVLSGNTFKHGAYSGAAEASQQLADFYLKQAEATMPVIAVDAGRKVSILFTKSKALSFETTDSYKVANEPTYHVERVSR